MTAVVYDFHKAMRIMQPRRYEATLRRLAVIGRIKPHHALLPHEPRIVPLPPAPPPGDHQPWFR